jgi:hypothetical protein
VLRWSLLLSGGALVGCGASGTTSDGNQLLAWPAEDRWPERFWDAAPDVQEAYRYAVANPSVLEWMPCFCGCGSQGHASNKDCYIVDARSDGSVVLDPMSFG